MKKGLGKIVLALVAVGLSMVLLLAAALPVCDAGPDEKEIKIGFHAGFTGPTATTSAAPSCLPMDYARYLSEEGGIHGIKVRVLWEDTGVLVSKAIAAHKRFVEAGVLVELIWATTVAEVLAPRAQRDGLPIFYMGPLTTQMITKGKRWVIAQMAPAPLESANFMKWVKANWTEERPPRIGMIMHDSAGGWDVLEGFQVFAPKLGVEFAGYEVIPIYGVVDTSTEWLRLAGKKPDWIYQFALGNAAVVAIKDAARLEIMQKGIKLCGLSVCGMSEDLIGVVGEDTEGWYVDGTSGAVWPSETELPGMKVLFDVVKRYRGWEPERLTHLSVMVGWLGTQVPCKAIEKAIHTVGFANLSGAAVRDALVTLEPFDTGFGIKVWPVSEEYPYLYRQKRMARVQGGKIIPISDWYDVSFIEPIKD